MVGNIVAEVLSHKWPPIVLTALHHHGPRRFRELARAIVNSGERTLSDRALSDALHLLSKYELVARQVEADTRSPYQLTDSGVTVAELLKAMTDAP